jgi:hypothetical protein
MIYLSNFFSFFLVFPFAIEEKTHIVGLIFSTTDAIRQKALTKAKRTYRTPIRDASVSVFSAFYLCELDISPLSFSEGFLLHFLPKKRKKVRKTKNSSKK